MDKRTKILLGVLGVLILLAGAYAGVMMMSAEDMVETAPVQVARKVAPPKKPAAPAVAPEAQPQPSAGTQTPAPAEAPAATTAPGTPVTAPGAKAPVPAPGAKAPVPAPGAKAPAPAPGAKAPAPVPGAKAPVPVPGAKAPVPVPGAKAPVPVPGAKAPAAAAAAKTAPCAISFKVTVKGKVAEYGTPEELVEKSGMTADELKAFSGRNLADAKKSVEALKKSKAPKDAMDCAAKKLEAAEKLASLAASGLAGKQAPVVYKYTSLDKRDPFMSPLQIPKKLPKIQASAPPIEQVPSEQLTVRAIIWTDKGYRAMILTPDNRGYTVKTGDTIGNKKGRVEKITDKRVYIKELIPDIFGDIETRNIVLKLYKEKEAE